MTTHREELEPLVSAAQRVAGVVAARGRGDREGAQALLGSLSQEELSAGALLVADLSLNLLQRKDGGTLDQTVARLCVEIEHALDHRPGPANDRPDDGVDDGRAS